MESDRDDTKETGQRLQKTLLGAFSAPLKPLKNIPTKHGKQRATWKLESRNNNNHGNALSFGTVALRYCKSLCSNDPNLPAGK